MYTRCINIHIHNFYLRYSRYSLYVNFTVNSILLVVVFVDVSTCTSTGDAAAALSTVLLSAGKRRRVVVQCFCISLSVASLMVCCGRDGASCTILECTKRTHNTIVPIQMFI